MPRRPTLPLVLIAIPFFAGLAALTACDLLPSRAKTAFVGDSALSYARQIGRAHV